MATTMKACEICGQDGFENIQAYGAHKRHAHPGWRNRLEGLNGHRGTTGHRCPDCGKSFATEKSLQGHQAGKHGSRRKNYPCPDCNRKFVRPTDLAIHVRNHHRDQTGGSSQAAQPTRVVGTGGLAYCPCCGANIRIIMQALAAVEGLT